MIIHRMQQGTPEWHHIRAGKITGSVAATLCVDGKGKYGLGAGAITAAEKIAMERITGAPMATTGFKSSSMSRGNEFETVARRKYELYKFVKVDQVGFIESDCGTYGCSPDGLIGDDGMCEIKSFTLPDLHFDLLNNRPSKHIDMHQIKFGLFTAKRKWLDFVSWYPEYTPMPLIIRTFYADEIQNITYKTKIDLFNKYVAELIEEIKANENILKASM